jgi:parvulin-like peptidyl-prolyl isomerase
MTRGRLAVLALLAACGGGRGAPDARVADHFTGSFSPAPASDAEVVATVDGEHIYASDVARQAAARGQTPRQALDELIDAELLAGEARRRGLADHPEVAEVRKRERVRALLQRVFEPSFDGPEDIPLREVEQVYDLRNVRAYYDHDRYHTAAYVRAPAKEDAPPEVVEAARARAREFYAAAVKAKPSTKEDFFALARSLPPGPKLEAAANQVYSTTRRGPAVKEFADAAFSLSEIGDLAPPARTKWGWDVLMLVDIIPERHTPRDEAIADLRVKRFEPARRLAFMRWLDGMVKAARIERNDALLEQVQVDSLIGM